MTRLVRLVSVSLALVGCVDQESAHTGRAGAELLNGPTSTVTFNALTGNALTGNALTGNALTGNALTGNALTGNALTGNALTGNALTGNALTGNGLTVGQLNREFFRYMYGCAARADQHITVTLDGQEHRFDGAIGIAPQWVTPISEGGTGKCDHECQRWMTACMLARTNAFGVPVPISIRGSHPALATATAEEISLFPLREGSYYGNIFGGAIYGDGGRYACTGPASNEPSQTARLCSNGGTEPAATPCRITIEDECFVPPAEAFSDPVLGPTASQCTTQASSDGHITGCRLNAFGGPIITDEVITVFVKTPAPRAGNGVCEDGESSMTTSDCGFGWAKVLADKHFVSPTDLAVDSGNNVIIAGTTTGGAPDFGGGPVSGAFWLAKYNTNGAHVASRGIGSGTSQPTALATDASNNIFVVGILRTGDVGGAALAAGGFVAKYSPSGLHLWSVSLPVTDAITIDGAGNPIVGAIAGADAAAITLDANTGAVVGTVTHVGGGRLRSLLRDAAGNLVFLDSLGVSLHSTSGAVTDLSADGSSIAIDGANHLYVVSSSSVEKYSYTAAGSALEWRQRMETNGESGFGTEPPQIAFGADGNVVVGGSYNGGFSFSNVVFRPFTANVVFSRGFVLKLRPDGSVVWGKEMVTSVTSPMRGFALDGNGDVAVTGTFEGNVLVDGVSLLTARQSQQRTSSEIYLAKIGNQLVRSQPNDRAGGAIPIATLGDGLKVEYFDDLDFRTPVGSSIDRDANLVGELPVSGEFSVRWTGTLKSDITDTVLFSLDSEGAAKVFVDGTLVIDDSADHARRATTGTFTMTARRRHDLRIEYAHRATSSALMQLSWKSSSALGLPEPLNGAISDAMSSERTRTFTGSTAGLGDDYKASCGGAGGADAVYKFTVTEPTRIRANTLGSSFDTVLYLRDGSTTAGEVVCNDDLIAGATQSSIDQSVGPGTYLVIVDGKGGASGNYLLNVTFDDAAANDIDADATFVSDTNNGGRFYGTTRGYADNHTGSCGGAGSADAVYRLELTSVRHLHVDTNGSDFDTTLYLTQGTQERACNDDVGGSKQSAIDVTLGPGTYYVHVDGKGGVGGTYRADFFLEAAKDTTPLEFVQPANIAVIATAATGNVVTFPLPTATDELDASLDIACSPASGSTFAVGTTTVSCTARDDAGNVGNTSFTVSVTYAFSGLLAPVNADGSSVFKRNSTIALKFKLTGASAGITDLVARVFITKYTNLVLGDEVEAVSTSAASTGNTFRYDATAGQYVFNLGTKGLSTGTYQIRIDLGDGVQRVVRVSLN